MGKRSREKDKTAKKSKKQKTGQEEELLAGYSNESNPFGDSNLTKQFVWKKKIQQDREQGKVSKKDKKKSKGKEEKKRLKGVQKELEKAKLRREEREREKRQWEEEMSRLDRERNKQQSEDWESRELSFHLIQAKRRSEIRIKEGRAKSIDWLYQWVMLGYSNDRDNEHERQKLFPIYNPCDLIADLTLEQLQELGDDIKIILSSQNDYTHAYQTLLVLCQYEMDKKNGAPDVMTTLSNLGVTDLFIDKSSSQLKELQKEVQDMLNAGGAIDVTYWESVLKASHLFLARAILRETHLEILEKRSKLIGELPEHAAPQQHKDKKLTGQTGQDAKKEMLTPTHEGEEIYDEESEAQRLAQRRLRELEQGAEKFYQQTKPRPDVNAISTEDILWKRESDKGLDENEEEFASEVDLKKREYSWNDLHRPRKPKYYNRVKTGFEWNKYNQTHYDVDNPPPKIIQGYKFNIFYPDLIDPTKSPTFHVEESEEDTTIIRFHAGPPYEDIAFRIVNKDWESSHRKGYRCVFDRGVLQLWFNFKRYRYRR
uniref:Splicing factor Cactin n=1 Tax=Vannella robusta TaxID=1487602 RepID=A0A7S4IFX2_9EUKA